MTVVRRCQALWQLFVWQGQGVYASVWKRNNESFRIKLFFERKGPKFVWPWLSWICVNNKLMVHHHPKQIFKPRNLFSFFGLTHLAIIGKTHTKWTLHNVLLCTTWYVLKPPIAIECSEVMSAEWICECVQVFVWRGARSEDSSGNLSNRLLLTNIIWMFAQTSSPHTHPNPKSEPSTSQHTSELLYSIWPNINQMQKKATLFFITLKDSFERRVRKRRNRHLQQMQQCF